MLASTNLAVRFLLELSALGAVGVWGAHTGNTALAKIALGAGLPLALAVVWGKFVAPKAGVHVSVPVHILLQVVVFGSAAAALYSLHRTGLAAAFGGTVAINAVLMVAMGQ